MGTLRTRTAGSRLAIVLTTVIVTTVVVAGGVALATVGRNSVGSAQIKNGSIRSVDIATGGVKSVDIANGTVRSADIANGSVRGLDIKDGTIRSADIADGTITSPKIANGTVTGADIANRTVTAADLAGGVQPAGLNFADGNQGLVLTSAAQSVRSVMLDAPAAGQVMVTASGYVILSSTNTDQGICSITDGAIALDNSHFILVDDIGIDTSQQAIPVSGTRSFAVPAGPTTFRLVCRKGFGSVAVFDSQITALYVPQLYAP